MFAEQEFISEGAILRGRWYSTKEPTISPCIVMCNGTSATVSMALSSYADEFQKNGFNVFLFDHVGFGRSEGKDRQTINPWVQGKGVADAVEFVKSQVASHNGKIILWGDSFSGMLVLVVAGLVDGLSGTISFAASCGVNVLDFKNPKESLTALKTIFYAGEFDQLGDSVREGPMPVVSSDQEANPSLLKPIQAFRWFIEQGGQWNSGWENRVTRVIPETDVPFSPLVTAPFIKAPVLMMIGKQDEMPQISTDVQSEVFRRVKSKKQIYEIDGGHFGALYPDTSLFYEAIDIQLKFIKSII